ncbi:ABC transporter permease [Myroides odoratus]|uniref:ABC transporter permease n=1 Tax=Myroides odoratus TaxID=256 RepID=UPI00333F489A
MLQNWLKIYLYNCKKHKAYFFLTILCLAMGITAVLLSTLYIKEESAFDQWNTAKNEIYYVEYKGEVSSSEHHPFILSKLLKEQYSFVQDYLIYSGYTPEKITYKAKSYQIDKVIQSNQSFFDFFPYPFIYGTKEKLFNHPQEVVFDKEQAALLFGANINPIGEQVSIDNQMYTVVGVYDLGGKRSSFMPEAVVNDFQFIAEEDLVDWNYSASSLLIKTANKEKASQAIEALYQEHFLKPMAKKEQTSLEELLMLSGGYYNKKAKLYALVDLHFDKENTIQIPEKPLNPQFIYVILGLSWVLLILSLFNYVNLSLSQALTRAKEVGIRKVLGGLKQNSIVQNLVETFITICLSFVVSSFLTLWILPFANTFLLTQIEIRASDFIWSFIGISVLILLIAGLIPALYISNYKVLNVLKGDFHRNRSGAWIKNAFLIVQFAIASCFIIGTYIVYEQVNYMIQKDLGFRGERVINFPFLEQEYGGDKQAKYDAFKAEALQIKGIEQIAVTDLDYGKIGLGGYAIFFNYEDLSLDLNVSNVEAGYFEMMEVKLKEGRFLKANFANDSIENAVINESALALIQKETAKEVVLANRTIVGVVQDFHITGLEETIRPMMFVLPSEQYNNYRSVSAKVNLEYLETLIPELEKLWNVFNSETGNNFEYQFVDKQFARSFETIQMQKKVLLFLSYIVVFIALFGLFAVSSFTIGTKLKEISIRKVLGAETKSLLQKLSYQYVIYCIIGFGLSILPSYYLLNLWLKDYAYRIEIGYEVYLVCFVLMVLLTLIIVVSRAYKATKVNVLKYIKYE